LQICKPFFSFIGGTSGGRTHDKRIKRVKIQNKSL
jgi:hypothetical protein